MNIKEIHDKLKHGDKTRIAEMCGCSVNMVERVFGGSRNSDTKTGQKIIKAANLIIKHREKAQTEFLN